jgi:thioredoxin-like negative regulator of GroEL
MKIVIKNSSSRYVKEIKVEDFDEITKSDKPYVIKFTSTTCYLCKALKPIFEQVAEQYKDKFYFGNVNSKTQRNLFKVFEIDGVPEIFIIFNNNIYNVTYPSDNPDPKSGYSKQYIIENLESYLNENR